MKLEDIRAMAMRIMENVEKVIVGKGDVIEKLLIALIAEGHVLLEDVPGTGKTLLAKSIAKSLDCDFKRVQFTPDLLPSDLSGINFFNQKEGRFEFREGPIFTNILLGDEINRATPRTQSSLLECMEEKQVTVDGDTMILDKPFMVIATQNPVDTQGTFPLPEAQLDRFLLKVNMGYPMTDEGIEILRRFKDHNPLDEIEAVASAEEIVLAQRNYSKVHVSHDLMEYIVRIVEMTRQHGDILLGASPRASQALLKASQVLAILRGKDFVSPDEVKEMVPSVLGHRIILRNIVGQLDDKLATTLDNVLRTVPVPAEDIDKKTGME